MRTLAQLALCCLLATCAFGQRGGGRMGGGRVGGGAGHGRFIGGGMGRGGFVHSGPRRGGISVGNFHRGFGFGSHTRGRVVFRNRGYFNRSWFGGYSYGYPLLSYPLYWGGWYDPFYSYDPYYTNPYPYQAAPNVTVVYPYNAQAAPVPTTPPVYVTQHVVERARPVIHEYSPPAESAAKPEQTIYLIAFKDQIIRAAEAYWVDGTTLHYVTLQHQEKKASLDTVDRAFSERLNRDRRVPFNLPAAK